MTPFAGASSSAQSSTNANTSITANTTNTTIAKVPENNTYAPNATQVSNTTDITDESEYPDKIVLSTVLIAWFIYIIALMFAWHKDKEDAIKVRIALIITLIIS